jgi:hypothetical protein
MGHENTLDIGIYGTKGSIEWSQEHANYLKISKVNHPRIICIVMKLKKWY